jgi:hypothetical protein
MCEEYPQWPDAQEPTIWRFTTNAETAATVQNLTLNRFCNGQQSAKMAIALANQISAQMSRNGQNFQIGINAPWEQVLGKDSVNSAKTRC